jgi:hypothetical protein
VLLLFFGTLFLTLGVLALYGELNTASKGTPRELVRAPPQRRRGTRADAQTLAACGAHTAPHASARRVCLPRRLRSPCWAPSPSFQARRPSASCAR